MRPRPRQLLDYTEFPILYVDDEPENLRVFELTFKRDFKIVGQRPVCADGFEDRADGVGVHQAGGATAEEDGR